MIGLYAGRVAQALVCGWLLTACLIGVSPVQARSVALLIGVSDYGHPRRNLEGPVHDVAALRDVLVRRWGFAPQDVRVLLDGQATKLGILDELRALERRTQPGDDILIYFSGHGTSALDSVARLPVPHGSGAFVPSGFDGSSPERIRATMIVGRTDTRPLYEALERGGRRLWVISDSCFAGNQVRSVFGGDELPERVLPLLDPRDQREREADESLARQRPALEPYPYAATAYLAASGEGERARDIPRRALARYPTLDGRPHGALTDALLRVLEGQLPADINRDGLLDLNEVHRAVTDFMARRAYGHSPLRLPAVAEDQHGLGTRPVLQARGMAAAGEQRALAPLRLRLGPGMPPEATRAAAAVADLTVLTGPAEVDAQVVQQDSQWLVLTGGGDRITEFAAGDTNRLRAQLVQLAFAQRLRLLGERHRRGVLEMETMPNTFGGNLRVGESMYFSVRPDREAWLVIVNINADGKVTVLYPFERRELGALPAGQARAIPGDSGGSLVQVKLPLGMDTQLAFAFDQRPDGWERLLKVEDVDPADARLQALERMLAQMGGRFTTAQTWLRVGPALRRH